MMCNFCKGGAYTFFVVGGEEIGGFEFEEEIAGFCSVVHYFDGESGQGRWTVVGMRWRDL